MEEEIYPWILEKPKCFNCNVYGYIAKDCRKLKREQDTRKCYKCNKIWYIAKDCKTGWKMKNRSFQKETNEKINNKQEDFVGGLE